MTCPACTNARQHPQSGRYDANCDGCAARSIARLHQFFEAVRAGHFTPQYRMALQGLLPKLLIAEAHRAVKEWVA